MLYATSMTLIEFASYLEHHNLIDIKRITDESDDGFENRLKLQKYVYLAKSFGLNLGYHYNIHLYGPYSRQLTKDYYNLNPVDTSSACPPRKLQHEDFMSSIGDKEPKWLEIAATIIYEKNIDENFTLERLYLMKCDHLPAFIDSVYADLKDLNLL